MDNYEAIISTLALTMGASWASGINLYAAVLMLGFGGATDAIDLPVGLDVLENPLVILAAGVMYVVEFFADKIPGLDSTWDALHTFVRIPAGAMLAASSVGDVTPAFEVATGLLGGAVATASHATKAGTRLLINTSPEPVSNWTASFTEDFMVIGGLWTALNHPMYFLIGLVIFLVLAAWLLPKIWRFIVYLVKKIGSWLGVSSSAEDPSLVSARSIEQNTSDNVDNLERLERLKQLLDQGALTQEEFEEQKRRLLR